MNTSNIPQFTVTQSATTRRPDITRHAAATALGVNSASLTTLINTGILAEPLTRESVQSLAHRGWLSAAAGELTVLRVGELASSNGDLTRPSIGFSLDLSDADLEAAVLRWWRSNPDRILRNQLFAVTVRTIPVALYQITGVANGGVPIIDDQGHARYHYEGTLLARLVNRSTLSLGEVRRAASSVISGAATTDTFVIVGDTSRDNPYATAIKQIMHSRIVVKSGGPIGYLS